MSSKPPRCAVYRCNRLPVNVASPPTPLRSWRARRCRCRRQRSSGLFAAGAHAQRYKKLPHQPEPHTVSSRRSKWCAKSKFCSSATSASPPTLSDSVTYRRATVKKRYYQIHNSNKLKPHNEEIFSCVCGIIRSRYVLIVSYIHTYTPTCIYTYVDQRNERNAQEQRDSAQGAKDSLCLRNQSANR